jgi:two-component system OmpR family response regulator
MAYILIVDDDADFAHAASVVLKSMGHETEIKLDTKDLRRKIAQRRPDLLILDVMFPENDSAGFDAAREIRTDPKLPAFPILMLTAVNTKFPLGFSAEDIDESWLPITDFLEKPVDFDVLKKKVSALLELKK